MKRLLARLSHLQRQGQYHVDLSSCVLHGVGRGISYRRPAVYHGGGCYAHRDSSRRWEGQGHTPLPPSPLMRTFAEFEALRSARSRNAPQRCYLHWRKYLDLWRFLHGRSQVIHPLELVSQRRLWLRAESVAMNLKSASRSSAPDDVVVVVQVSVAGVRYDLGRPYYCPALSASLFCRLSPLEALPSSDSAWVLVKHLPLLRS